MNPQRNLTSHSNNNIVYQRQLSSVSQIQNTSMTYIKPLAYPCRYHPDEICLNYCIQPKCFQALCSQCIEQHLLHHKKLSLNDLYVKSFKSVRSQCSNKLIKIIDKLLAKLTILSQPKNPQEMLDDVDKQLQAIRLLMHQIIDQQFSKIRQAIKNKVSENFSTVKDLNQIHQNLIKIINQLKQHNTIISQGILDHPVNVGDSIQKTLLLNESALLQMFEKQSWKYDQKFRNINVDIYFSQSDFRQSTVSCLKIGSSSSPNAQFKGPNNSRLSQFGQVAEGEFNSRLRSRSKSPINEKLNENGRKMVGVNYPVLHYFQTGENILHLIDLKGQPTKKRVQLGNFKVPAFHASLLSQKTGSIFIGGGNIESSEKVQKSQSLSRYSLISGEFKRDFARVKARSSHVICQDISTQSLYILGGYGESVQIDQDESNAIFETSVQKVNIKNGSVQQVSSSHYGGACMAVVFNTFIIKGCMQGVEIYDSRNNLWSQLSNIKSHNLQSVFSRGIGYSILNQNTSSVLLIYGGYDQNQQSKKQCYLMNVNINMQRPVHSSVEIQSMNCTLPIAQGFWNNPGVIYQNSIWVLQNVQDQEGLPNQAERTLMKLDIDTKKWNVVKTVNK